MPGIPEIGTGYKTKYRNWHDLGHNPNFQGTNHKLIADKWCMAEFAAFIKKLQAITEPGGTMLDNSLVVWGNHMEDGSQPRHPDARPGSPRARPAATIKTGLCVGEGRSTADAIARVLPRLRRDARRQGDGRLPRAEGLGAGDSRSFPHPYPLPLRGARANTAGTRDAIRLTERIVRPRPRSGRG